MNHYDYLEQHFEAFYFKLCEAEKLLHSIEAVNRGIIVAHGDKCYQYKAEWERGGLAFEHGTAIYLLTYIWPWSSEVRETATGWVAPATWVLQNAERFRPYLPPIPGRKLGPPDEHAYQQAAAVASVEGHQ